MTQVEIPEGVTLPGAIRAPTAELARRAPISWRDARFVGFFAAAAAAIALVIYLFVPRTYTATTSFIPESPSPRLPSGLLGMADLAGQFGISLGNDAARSPRFYTDVINSRQLVERALLSTYVDPRETKGDSTTLLAILNPKGTTPREKLAEGVRRFRTMMVTQLDAQTGLLRFSVRSPYPTLAASVANRYVAAINDFNSRQRQSQARERRQFVERRLATTEQELRAAEENIRTFYERNRRYDQSPQLRLDEDRLRRDLDMRQQVVSTLQRELETARIQEVNDTPVITVIDTAVAPTTPSSPRPFSIVSIAAVVGGICGALVLVGRHHVNR